MAPSTGTMLTAGKLAEALGVSQGKVKKLIVELRIKPDEVARGCNYYAPSALAKLKAELRKAGA